MTRAFVVPSLIHHAHLFRRRAFTALRFLRVAHRPFVSVRPFVARDVTRPFS
jgi:hypothetical protein